MAERSVKEEVRKIADQLPSDATWEDVAHLVWMHQRLAQARRDSAAGLGVPLEEVEKEFGLTP